MNHGWLVVSNDNYARSTVGLQFFRDGIQELGLRVAGDGSSRSAYAYGSSQGVCELFHVNRSNRQAVVCLKTGGGRSALNDVQAVHAPVGIAAGCVIAGVARESRASGIQEISIK